MSDPTEDKIEKISESSEKSRADQAARIDQMTQETAAPDKVKFDAAMDVEKTASQQQLKTSLMDEIRSLNRQVDVSQKATPEQLGQQVETIVAKIDDLKAKLSTPDLEIKQSAQNILQNKLDHIDENLKVALDKAGLEYPVSSKTPATNLSVPITRYLDYLTDGQAKLGMLGSEIQKAGANGKQFSPADMIALQIKVGYVQQELEFFTSLLNKALESTKTIMNVQV